MRFSLERLFDGILDVGVDVREESQHPLFVPHQRDVAELVDEHHNYFLTLLERRVKFLDRDL